MDKLVALLIAGGFAALFGSIFRKMGYTPWSGLLSVVPVVNLFWFVYVAMSEWPIERQLARLADEGVEQTPDCLALMFARAESLERSGRFAEAAEHYQILADELGDQAGAGLAAHCAERLRSRANGA